jgi:hypothetical protein
MSTCNQCYQAEIVPVCSSELVFGTIVTDSETVTVYLKNDATGRINQFIGDVDEAGYVTFSGINLSNNLGYEIWVTEDGANIADRLTITNLTNEYTCISFKAKRISEEVEFLSYDLMITE